MKLQNQFYTFQRFLTLSFFGFWGMVSPIKAQVLPKAKVFNLSSEDYTNNEALKSIFPVAQNARLVFTGENHYQVAFNSLMEYTMMRALYENAGYRNYIIEMSPSRAHYMQRFICDNDSQALRYLQSVSSPRYMKIFYLMHDWNQKLKPEDRIKIYGVDVERFDDLSADRMLEFFKRINKNGSKEIPLEILNDVFTFSQYVQNQFDNRWDNWQSESSNSGSRKTFSAGRKSISNGNKQMRFDEIYATDTAVVVEAPFMYSESDFDALKEFIKSVKTKRSSYASWLGADFNEFMELFRDIDDCNTWNQLDNSAMQHAWREENIFRNLANLLNKHPQEKFFGQFGRCHIVYSRSDKDCGWYDYHSVVNRLNERYFKDNSNAIVSIGIFYSSKEEEISTDKMYEYEALNKEVAALKKVVSEKVLVYDLNDSDSQLKLLKTKFQFVMVNHSKDSDLEDIKEEFEEPTYKKRSNRWDFVLMPIGLEYSQMDYGQLNAHFLSAGKVISSPSNLRIQHELGSQNRNFIYTVFGSYTPNTYRIQENYGGMILDDSTGSVYHKAFNLGGFVGYRIVTDLWDFQLGAELAYNEQKLQFDPKSNDFFDPKFEQRAVVQNSTWTAGGRLQVNYHLNKRTNLGLRMRTSTNLMNGVYYFDQSQILYTDLGKNAGLNGWGVSLNLNFRIRD
jgi:hypothetical protein